MAMAMATTSVIRVIELLIIQRLKVAESRGQNNQG
jgi:hypothetical protein